MKSLWAGLLLLHGSAGALEAQGHTLEASYGTWRSDTVAVIWAAGLTNPLPGPFDYGLTFVHLDDHRSPLNRTQSGGEFSLATVRDRTGPYALAAVGLAMKHDDGNFDASWSAGGGFTLRLFPFLALGIEGRYRTEDQLVRGFWNLDAADRRGWLVSGRAALLWSGGTRARNTERPSRRSTERAASRLGIARSDLAAQVVATALEAMGTPYRWGGQESNGYDCSGLIQFAYDSHGIAVPRISRDQAAAGRGVALEISRLAPGDILGFSVEGDRVTHVGLYVGDGRFIHSASGGVKLSSLSDRDPDSLWWRRRWAAARRILD